MKLCTTPRHLRDDEEPEREFVTVSVWGQGLCSFCGHTDHAVERCPYRPAA